MSDAAGLTDALLRPLRRDHCLVSRREVEHLGSQVCTLAAESSGFGPFRLTDHLVKVALSGAASVQDDAPFVWSAATARRGLGVAGVRTMLAGKASTPIGAVDAAIGQAINRHRRGERGASSMDAWLAGLGAAAIASVRADAVTWATRLWSGLDWTAFAAAPVIGRDHWWDSPRTSLLALRSRAEVRAQSTNGRGDAVSVHLVVLNGPRRASIGSELAVVALIESLRTNDPFPPGRIVGWWPDSGHVVSTEVNHVTLAQGVETVAATLAYLKAKRANQDGASGAAA